jgi:hypothetical protein
MNVGAGHAAFQLKKGATVAQLTKKVGQVPRTGKITAIHGETVEVRWDDGTTGVTSKHSLVPATRE